MEKQKMKKPLYKKWLSIVIVLIVVIGVIPMVVGCGTDDPAKTGSDTAATAATEEETTKAEEKTLSISAKELFEAYDDNEVKADEKYKGKMMKISGTISDIGKDIMDESYITLKSSSSSYEVLSVQCMFSDETEAKKLGDLKKGDKVKIIGECDGVTINVLIKDCKIIK